MDIVKLLAVQFLLWGYLLAAFLFFAFWLTPERLDASSKPSPHPLFDRGLTRIALITLFAGVYYACFRLIQGYPLGFLLAAAVLAGVLGSGVSELLYCRRRAKMPMKVDLPGFWKGEPAFGTLRSSQSADFDFGEDAISTTSSSSVHVTVHK